MSVCQPWPASLRPTSFPSSFTLDRIITSGRPGAWKLFATLCSSWPKRGPTADRPAAARRWAGVGEAVRDVGRELAEAGAEGGRLRGFERLAGEAQHPSLAERAQDGPE